MSKDKIGDRMKENYENRTKQFLTRRTPTIIRLDGKSFHTYTKGLNRPFDEGLIEDMQQTTIFLCENIQGCKLGYTQSDEITLVLTDYDNLQTHAWFDYNVQKVTSISAAMATAKFNDLRLKRAMRELEDINLLDDKWNKNVLAFFDSRVFQIPEKEEVVNSLIWRQQDAERNSIQMLAQSLYSQKQLHGKNTSILQDMCFERGYNWNDLEVCKKRGSLITKQTYINGDLVDNINIIEKEGEYYKNNLLIRTSNTNPTIRTKWEVVNTPIFSKGRNVILDLI
jgi:tRNA(His) guanylyltransferase